MLKLENALAQMKIPFENEMINKFYGYMKYILQWNEKVNLTAICDEDAFIEKHFIDSVVCMNEDEYKNANSIIDVGTGAGFPGVPLAILSPEKEFLLLDSLGKRIKILKEILADLEIENVTLLHARSEDAGREMQYREAFDLCVSRAVASLPVLCEYCLPFVKVGGSFFAYKGKGAEDELMSAEKAVRVLGGKTERLINAKPGDMGVEHKIISIKKIEKTPMKYPRKAGTPTKEPI